jgi:peptide/nickel transport system substrate-binding protein
MNGPKAGCRLALRVRQTSAVLALVLLFAAGSGSYVSAASSSSPSGTVTFALPVGSVPTYIFPFVSGPESNNIDLFQFSPFLWRPLYWFGHNGQPGISYEQSMAGPPTYSNGGRTATITLNQRFKWSDGQPVTNRDVELWMNIFEAERTNWEDYSVGSIPDDVTSMSFPSSTPYQFSITFNKAYSHLWLLYDQLSQIWPIPQHVWDRTSASGPVGNYDTTTAGAAAVYNFLNTQSEDESSYPSNPLWKTVDGPWLVQGFSPSTGETVFVPNPNYTGPGKPHIARFVEIPFTSSAAEYDALRSGQLDYGYLPSEDLSQKSYFTSRGYKIATWPDFGFNAIFLNFTNPVVGPIFKQLYIRQAMQELINQPEISKDIYHGQAFPTYGPVPIEPPSQYLSKKLLTNPYPYSVSHAKALLSSHGWTVRPNGVDSCSKPGDGSGECGSGIARGARLAFVEEAGSGSAPFSAEAEVMQSSWSQAGIQVTLRSEPPTQIYTSLGPCSDGNTGCKWEIANASEPGATATYSPEYLPSPQSWVATGGASNIQGYSNAKMDALINATDFSSAPAAVQALSLYAGQQLPMLWEPNYPYQLSVISSKIHGALPQDPNLNLYPQDWTLSS